MASLEVSIGYSPQLLAMSAKSRKKKKSHLFDAIRDKQSEKRLEKHRVFILLAKLRHEHFGKCLTRLARTSRTDAPLNEILPKDLDPWDLKPTIPDRRLISLVEPNGQKDCHQTTPTSQSFSSNSALWKLPNVWRAVRGWTCKRLGPRELSLRAISLRERLIGVEQSMALGMRSMETRH